MCSIGAMAVRRCSTRRKINIAFLDLMAEAGERLPMRLLAWCLNQTTFIWFCGHTATET